MRRGEIYEESDDDDIFDKKKQKKLKKERERKERENRIEVIPLDFKFSDFSTKEEKEEIDKYIEENKISYSGSLIAHAITSFYSLPIDSKILEIIKEQKWEKPTAIQASAIPVILNGRDIVGISKTGSGKTAAFLIPAMQHIIRQPKQFNKGPVVLVLSPTRELAQQCDNVAERFANRIGIKRACIYGGEKRETQIEQINKKPELITATPGRMIDFIDSGVIDLRRVSYLVIDEADRMLDMGFGKQLKKIISNLPSDRQTLMFSATWPEEVQNLCRSFLMEPVIALIGDNYLSINDKIKQIVIKTTNDGKDEELKKVLLNEAKGHRALVFVNTKKQTNDLASYIKKIGRRAVPLNGDMTQTQRDQSMHKFKKDTACVLVATDVAARGLDVDDIRTVVNYDMPIEIQNYIHRIGRTARADRIGIAVSFFTEKDAYLSEQLVDILKESKQDIPDWLK